MMTNKAKEQKIAMAWPNACCRPSVFEQRHDGLSHTTTRFEFQDTKVPTPLTSTGIFHAVQHLKETNAKADSARAQMISKLGTDLSSSLSSSSSLTSLNSFSAKNLTQLQLRNIQLTDPLVTCLVSGLSQDMVSHILSLDVSHNQITSEGVAVIVQTFLRLDRPSSSASSSLSSTRTRTTSASSLAKAPSSSTTSSVVLARLIVSDNPIGNVGAHAIAAALSSRHARSGKINQSLRCLKMRNIGLDDKGGEAFFKALLPSPPPCEDRLQGDSLIDTVVVPRHDGDGDEHPSRPFSCSTCNSDATDETTNNAAEKGASNADDNADTATVTVTAADAAYALTQLDLAFNELSTRTITSFIASFAALPHLATVDLTSNALQDHDVLELSTAVSTAIIAHDHDGHGHGHGRTGEQKIMQKLVAMDVSFNEDVTSDSEDALTKLNIALEQNRIAFLST
jgi:hypothetical protein